jgi:hypothetical protein
LNFIYCFGWLFSFIVFHFYHDCFLIWQPDNEVWYSCNCSIILHRYSFMVSRLPPGTSVNNIILYVLWQMKIWFWMYASTFFHNLSFIIISTRHATTALIRLWVAYIPFKIIVKIHRTFSRLAFLFFVVSIFRIASCQVSPLPILPPPCFRSWYTKVYWIVFGGYIITFELFWESQPHCLLNDYQCVWSSFSFISHLLCCNLKLYLMYLSGCDLVLLNLLRLYLLIVLEKPSP